EVIDGAPAQRTIEECLASAEHVLARRLKEAAPMEPVLARATRALRETRACGRSEVLLALLACARKHRSTPSVRTAQRACLEAGATAVPSPEPLTAAQFVWRCYGRTRCPSPPTCTRCTSTTCTISKSWRACRRS